MKSPLRPIDRLAELCGIEARFSDARGQLHAASSETLAALLAAMGIPAAAGAEITDAIAALEAEARDRLLPAAIVLSPGGGRVALPGPAEWRLELDDGRLMEGFAAESLEVASLPVGRHRLTVTAGQRSGSTTLLARPVAAPDCAALTGRARLWGIAAPLYGLRSDRNLGLGTYGDLAGLAKTTGRLGADYLAINPVHALFPAAPAHYSPYSPSHRRFLNTAHIDPQAVPEFAASEPAQQLLAQNAAAIDRLRRAELVDYPAVAALLQPLFERLFDAFEATCPPDTPRAAAFAAWRAERGAELDRFAVHQALSERYGAFWTGWPAALRDPAAPGVARFAAENPRRLQFHKYLQWIAAGQLAAAQSRARASGMGLGLVSDMAVGVRPDGAETWAEPELFARGVSLGAPPDAFNPGGQNWQLAPFRPAALRQDGYRAFAATLGATMRWSGAIRIDHIVGFARSYWIPDGAREGAYVRYPVDELLAVAAIEGHRQRCLVIGEDLGNVPPGLRDRMAAIGVHGCRLVYFERGTDGAFRQPGQYPSRVAAALGSHDLPSFRGWWEGSDIAARESLGLIDAAEAGREHAARATARAALRKALRAAGCLEVAAAPGENCDTAVMLAAHRFLAATESALATVQAENAFVQPDQLNMPGTIAEYPNWRRRLPAATAWETDETARRIIAIMCKDRPRHPGTPAPTDGEGDQPATP